MKSQLTLVAAVFFGAMGGSFLTRIIEPAKAASVRPHCHWIGTQKGMTSWKTFARIPGDMNGLCDTSKRIN